MHQMLISPWSPTDLYHWGGHNASQSTPALPSTPLVSHFNHTTFLVPLVKLAQILLKAGNEGPQEASQKLNMIGVKQKDFR